MPWFFEYLTAVKIEYILRDDLDISYQDLFKAYHKCLIDNKDCPITIYLVMIAIYDMGMEQDYTSYKPFIKDFVNNQGKFLKCTFDKKNILDYIEGFGTEFGPPKQSTSKAFGERDPVTLSLDDKSFYNWYSDKKNEIHARAFFVKIMMTLYTSRCKDAKTVFQHLQYRVYSQYSQFSSFQRPPNNFISSEDVIILRGKQIAQEFNFNNSLLRYILEFFDISRKLKKDVKSEAFFSYAIEKTFKFHGMHMVKLIDAVREEFDLTADKLPELFARFSIAKVSRQLEHYFKMRAALDYYSDHHTFEIDGSVFHSKYFEYARLFEGRCFLEASVSRNQSLMRATLSLLGPKWMGGYQIYGLNKDPEDSDTIAMRGAVIRNEILGINDPIPGQDGYMATTEIMGLQEILNL